MDVLWDIPVKLPQVICCKLTQTLVSSLANGSLCLPFPISMSLGQTKNWIALEDSLQRCNEPDEIKSHIASSALRTPNYFFDDKNVFAIYVSYYVKVKLTLSGMGGELSLKLPFTLAHFDEQPAAPDTTASTTATRADGLAQQESVATDDGTNEGACDTADKSIKSSSAETEDTRAIIVAEVENHNSGGSFNKYLKNPSRCSSSSSSGKAVAAQTITTTTKTGGGDNKGQVTRDGSNQSADSVASAVNEEEIGQEEEDVIAPPMSTLKQRRFSQARQERIRPEDDSLDRIETLSDEEADGEGAFEGHEIKLALEPDNHVSGQLMATEGATVVAVDTEDSGIGFRTNLMGKLGQKLTSSSGSLEETELLDEVFCGSLAIGQQPQEQQKSNEQQSPSKTRPQDEIEMPQSAAKTTSSLSAVFKGSEVKAGAEYPILNAQLDQMQLFDSSEFEKRHANNSPSTESTLVQIHAPQL